METTTYGIVYSVTNLSAGPSKDLDALVSAIGEWTSNQVRGKDLSMTGFAGSCPSRYDPKRGQREVAGEFSVPDSEGMVFEAARGGIENTEECHVRVDKGIVESGDSLRGYPAGVRSLRMSPSSRRLYSRWTSRYRCCLPRLCARAACLDPRAIQQGATFSGLHDADLEALRLSFCCALMAFSPRLSHQRPRC